MRRLEWGGWVAVAFSGAAMVVGVLVGVGEMLGPATYVDRRYTWLHLAPSSGYPNGFSLVVGTLVDPLSALMLIVVTVVGFLVMLYSIGYMHQDRGLPRYYAELSLFLAAMNGLVLSDNLLEFFLFWELVGVCSYFLIGFYYEKPSASSAAKEAFLVTRVGDVMFLLGIFLFFYEYAAAGPVGSGGWAANGFLFVQNGAAVPPRGRTRGQPDAPDRRRDHDPRRGGRKERPVPAPRLAAGRDGGPDDRLGAHPRGDDGRRGRLPARGHERVHRVHRDRLARHRRDRRASPRSSRRRWPWSTPTSNG